MYNVQFDPETHTYTVDGQPVPNVTQIVAPLGADYDEPDDDLELTIEAAADRGTTLHAYIEHRLQGGEREDFELPSIYAGYADSVDAFLADNEITPYLIETPLGCTDYAGTPDLIGERGGKVVLYDWKFVSQIAKSKVMAQIGGYKGLCFLNGVYPDEYRVVQFLNGGKYREYEVDSHDGEIAFALCINIQNIKNQKHPRGKIGGIK